MLQLGRGWRAGGTLCCNGLRSARRTAALGGGILAQDTNAVNLSQPKSTASGITSYRSIGFERTSGNARRRRSSVERCVNAKSVEERQPPIEGTSARARRVG